MIAASIFEGSVTRSNGRQCCEGDVVMMVASILERGVAGCGVMALVREREG